MPIRDSESIRQTNLFECFLIGRSFHQLLYSFSWFLADCTNGRAYATVLRLSVRRL